MLLYLVAEKAPVIDLAPDSRDYIIGGSASLGKPQKNKVLFLVARPIRGGSKGLATKERALKKSQKRWPLKK